jgi:3-hydroxyacyl-[acyl-carrier-protein] dehydratase
MPLVPVASNVKIKRIVLGFTMSKIDPQLLERLKLILRRDLKLGADARIADDMPFFGGDIDLDSLDMLLLVTSVEREFGVKIPNEAVGRTVFQSVTSLANYIQERGGAVKPSTAPQPAAAATAAAAGDPLERLPHRDPFRFVSRVTQIKPGAYAEGIWSLKGDEPFFAGHFPGNPLVPGVLLAEALAQVSGLAGTTVGVNESGKLAHIDVRFDRTIAPPVEIVLKSKLTRSMPKLQYYEVTAEVNGQIVARGSLTLSRG